MFMCMKCLFISDIEWRKPSQLIIIEDSLMRKILTPDLLRSQLGVSLLHDEVCRVLTPDLGNSMGVQKISTTHLLEAGKALVKNLELAVNSDEHGRNK